MDLPPGSPPLRVRGSLASRRPRRGPRVLVTVLVLVCLGAGAIAAGRVIGGLGQFGNPLTEASRSVDPPAGSLPWKLRHGQRVNLLLLGYGGSENDAPYLT